MRRIRLGLMALVFILVSCHGAAPTPSMEVTALDCEALHDATGAPAYLSYPLDGDFVRNWLVAGPVGVESDAYSPLSELALRFGIITSRSGLDPGIEGLPVDHGVLSVAGQQIRWIYTRTEDDHFVDLSPLEEPTDRQQAFVYTQIVVPATRTARFVLTTNGPADVWINGRHVHRQVHVAAPVPKSVPFQADLRAGSNAILIRFEQRVRQGPSYVMALAVPGIGQAEVRIPTETERLDQRALIEQLFPKAYLGSVTSFKGRIVDLHWADDLARAVHYQYTVQDIAGRVHLDGNLRATPGAQVEIGHPFRIWQGPFRLVLRAGASAYYEGKVRYQWELPFYILDTEYSTVPYGSYQERRAEALAYAATQGGTLYGEVAKLSLGRWDELDETMILEAAASLSEDAGYPVTLVGLLERHGGHSEFSGELDASLKAALVTYYFETSGDTSLPLLSAALLAGQRYPQEVFAGGKSGAWHQARAEAEILSWLRGRMATGFRAWDASDAFEQHLLSLAYLADWAQHTEIRSLSNALMDKVALTMALNSYQGAFGSTHSQVDLHRITTAKLAPTSGLNRLLFGMGVYNQHLGGLVAVAGSTYEPAPSIVDVATDSPEEMWNRERHRTDAWQGEVNKVTYRTADYMLSSTQDYRPGAPGDREHIWQATLGPEALVFVTHPARFGERNVVLPSFWTGNARLPRVAQWKDALIALYQLPADDWMGLTHAYFPTEAFDEAEIRDTWAFARQGEGYIALYASTGLSLTTTGPYAYRELRSEGEQAVWLVQMGRAALDGDFDAFKENVRALNVEVEGLNVRFETLRGEVLTFDWQGSLRRDGEVESLSGFNHYENPYLLLPFPAADVDIVSLLEQRVP